MLIKKSDTDPASGRPGAGGRGERFASRALYVRFLAEGRGGARGLRGVWTPGPLVGVDELERAVRSALSGKDARLLKEDYRTRVIRATVLGEDALVKVFELRTFRDLFKAFFRKSLARRFWAAARTMQALGISTPDPLGLLEYSRWGVARVSYVINRFVPEAVTVREWAESGYHLLPEAERNRFSDQLLEHLQLTYRHGLYHRDAKGENILLRKAEDPAARRFFWIDLECVRLVRHLSRRDIVRNVVQINGAIGSRVSRAERMRFLRQLAGEYPFLLESATIRHIAEWTRQRLENERMDVQP